MDITTGHVILVNLICFKDLNKDFFISYFHLKSLTWKSISMTRIALAKNGKS